MKLLRSYRELWLVQVTEAKNYRCAELQSGLAWGTAASSSLALHRALLFMGWSYWSRNN